MSICAGSVLDETSLGTGGNAALLIINGTASVSITCSGIASPPSCVLDGGNTHELVIAVGGGVVSITGFELRDGYAKVSGSGKSADGGALRQKGGSVSLTGDLIDHNYAYNVRAQRRVSRSLASSPTHAPFLDIQDGGAIDDYSGTLDVSCSILESNTLDRLKASTP